ncbi:hypothetical protein SAMN05446037_100672 [Anaerovirgula multivorans]|uniref:Low copy number virion structural protein n=1 Tax=Anaerovirgula multivorans TaxID=312168 RepID=A0A239CNR1_9FIRM|nr:hypothetical protein [Anaerovirgula multivorans]SNS21780.1 hypothetical protein SAMN05446037_100672 [Anaerovirgula multivorans]
MSFNVSYLSGGVVDKVRQLPYPHFSKLTVPYIKGRMIAVNGAGTYEDTFSLPFDTEFLSVAFACSDYCKGDYWDFYIGDVKVCETIYTKELPESVSMGNSFGIVYPLEPNAVLKFVFTSVNTGEKSVWYNVKFLRSDGDA